MFERKVALVQSFPITQIEGVLYVTEFHRISQLVVWPAGLDAQARTFLGARLRNYRPCWLDLN